MKPKKYQILLLSPKTKRVDNLTISIDGKVLYNTKTVELLGVTIHRNLTFKNQISSLCTSANNKLALQRIRKYLKLKCILSIHSLIIKYYLEVLLKNRK